MADNHAMNYRFLTSADFSALYKAYLDAFSDYIVDLRMSEQQLERTMIQNGVRFDFSVGAFDGDRMIGFTVNGFDLWGGQPTAYDSGTGVSPTHRRRGIAGELFNFMLPQLKKLGVRQYLLEVITSNEPAVNLYRKLGFRETRKLAVLKLDAPLKPAQTASENAVTIRDIAKPDWRLFQSFWDGQPSWQFSVESIARSVTQKIFLGAFVGDGCVGYAVASPVSGTIFQLAVDKAHRRKGIASLLLATLQARVETEQPLKINNLDYSLEGTQAFCAAAGFKLVLNQFEMEKSL